MGRGRHATSHRCSRNCGELALYEVALTKERVTVVKVNLCAVCFGDLRNWLQGHNPPSRAVASASHSTER